MIQSVWKNLTGLQKAAEHLWCDFKYRPWDKNSSPNTNDLYIHYMNKSYMDTPFFRREKGISKLWQQMETIHVLKNCISTSVATVLKWLYPYVQIYIYILFCNYTVVIYVPLSLCPCKTLQNCIWVSYTMPVTAVSVKLMKIQTSFYCFIALAYR